MIYCQESCLNPYNRLTGSVSAVIVYDSHQGKITQSTTREFFPLAKYNITLGPFFRYLELKMNAACP